MLLLKFSAFFGDSNNYNNNSSCNNINSNNANSDNWVQFLVAMCVCMFWVSSYVCYQQIIIVKIINTTRPINSFQLSLTSLLGPITGVYAESVKLFVVKLLLWLTTRCLSFECYFRADLFPISYFS